MKPFSEVVVEDMIQDHFKARRVLGISEEELQILLHCDDATFRKEYHKLVLKTKGMEEVPNLHNYFKALQLIDVERTYYSGLRLMVSPKNLLKQVQESGVNYSCLKDLDFEDIIVDTKECNLIVRVSKCRYTCEMSNTKYAMFTLNITIADSTAPLGFKTVDFDFCIEKLPRLFIKAGDNDTYVKCVSCGNCTERLYKFFEDSEIGVEAPAFLCGKLKRETGSCSLENYVKTLGYSSMDLLNIVVKAYELYSARRKRKNIPDLSAVHVGVYDTPTTVVSKKKPHQAHVNTSSYKLLSLKEYNSYERRVKKAYQGGHHSSPIEHERRGFYRHYASGKTVWVNATTVNKGHNSTKGIYKLDI